MVSCSHAAISLWFFLFFFFQFFGLIFFLNGFPNAFIVHSKPTFLFELIFFFSVVVFVTCGILTLVFNFIFNSRPHLLSRLLLRSYFFLLRQTFFRFTILPLFRHFAWNLFDFSRLVSLFSHSAKSEFEHQLLSKAIQNEQSRYKKLKSEIETG